MTHDEFHNLRSAYLAGGLADAERAAVEQHAASCPACAAALEQADAADRELNDVFAAARPGDGLEDRVIAHLRTAAPPPLTIHPLVRKAAVGVAAAILLGGVGFVVVSRPMRMERLAFRQSEVVPESRMAADADADLASPRSLALQLGEEIRSGTNKAGALPSLSLEQEIRARSNEWSDGGVGETPALQVNGGTLGGDGVAGEERRIRRGQSETQYRFDAARNTARQGIASGTPADLRGARAAVEQARHAHAANPTAQTPQQIQDWDAEIRETELSLGTTEVRAAETSQAGVNGRVETERVRGRGGAERTKESAVTNLQRTSERLTEAGRLDDDAAAGVNDPTRGLDPTNVQAGGAGGAQGRPGVVVAGKPVAGVPIEPSAGQSDYGIVDTYNAVEEPKIPYDDLLRTPTNWPDVSEPRDKPAEHASRETAEKSQTVEGETILGRRVIPLKGGTKPASPEDAAGKEVSRGERGYGDKRTAGAVAVAGQPGAPDQAGEVVRGTVNAVAQGQEPPPQVQPQPAQQQSERKVIRNGEMTFEVDGYDSSVLQITKIAAEEGGFVATTESEKLPNGKVKGSVVVRCPPERLDTLVLKLRGLGDLRSSRVSAQDVTKQYTDLDAQLRAAKTMEQRLLEIIKGGKGEVKDLIEAEKQLGSWREKIEKLEGEIRYYNNLVALSTLTVTLAERDVRAAALLSETEQVNMGVEATDVEKARAEAIKAIEEAKGRIVESDLKTHDAGQFAATIAADVAPDRAGPVIDRLKQLGRVSRLEVQRRQATAEGTGAPAPGARVERKDTRLMLSIYNLANVAARSRTDLHLAADDVEKAYRAILAQVESAGGRVINSQLTKPTPQQTTGTIAFEVPTGGADVLLDAVRGAGEVVRLETSTNPDRQSVTDAKRAFSVQVRSVTTIPARESITLQLAVDDVASKYDKLLDALRAAGARIVQSEIDQQDPNQTTATLEVDARRDQRAAVDKALADAGGVYGRAVSRPAEGEAALEDKVRLNVTMHDVDHLAPRETTTLGVEAQDVTKAASDVESTAVLLGGRKVDSDWAQQPGGQSIARVVVDVPVARAPELIDKARGQGRVLTVQRDQNPSSPDGAFARARLSVTFATADPIVQRDQSLGGSIRSGLSTSVEWLLRSVTLVVIGLCLVGPWALVLWLAWKVVQRRRRAAREGDETSPPRAPGAPAPVTSA